MNSNNLVAAVRAAFRPKSDMALAIEELEDAKRQRLQAQTAQEYATAMVAYHASRIERLQMYLETHAQGAKE